MCIIFLSHAPAFTITCRLTVKIKEIYSEFCGQHTGLDESNQNNKKNTSTHAGDYKDNDVSPLL